MEFAKYQSTGNDFILIDNRKEHFRLSRAEIARLCHRKFGIGADGLILLNPSKHLDFEMKNYNSDGGECSMCGNGGRALIQFARDLGIVKDTYRFSAIDGEHEARVAGDTIELKMRPVPGIVETPVGPTLDTGSPHLVVSVTRLLNHEVVKEGRMFRNSPLFMPGGINTNFFEIRDHRVFLRTYERGVEDETLSCGTGAIATAIVTRQNSGLVPGMPQEVPIHCQGGELRIRFTAESDGSFRDIWLIGPSVRTFQGKL
ncbi:MAG: diaminopimelate epimerase [Proteobacteria bacterium]|nr:diaminopimelate epimerase [Pseudomonadota bacterium]